MAPRKRLRKPVEEALKAVAVEALAFGEKPLACFRLNGSVEIEVLVARLCGLNRFHAGKGDPASFDGHQSNPAFILTEQAHRPTCPCQNARKQVGKLLLKVYLLLLVFFG